jgi:hypothetical protein
MPKTLHSSLLALALALAGCDINPFETKPASTAPVAVSAAVPEPAAALKRVTSTVPMSPVRLSSPTASFTDDGTGVMKLVTDPALGVYSVLLPLPVKEGPATIRVILQTTKGSVGAVVTRADDPSAWSTLEITTAAGAEASFEFKLDTLSPAKTLLLRNSSGDGVSEALVKAVEVQTLEQF